MAPVVGDFPVDGVGADASGVVDVVLWVDVEATGVDADCERLLEVAGVVTDMSGRTLGLEPFSRVVDQGSAVEAEHVVDGLRGRVAVMHARSGLSEQVRAVGGSGMVAGLVDMEMCAWLEECADAFVGLHGGESYRVWLGGNSVHADRGFVKRFFAVRVRVVGPPGAGCVECCPFPACCRRECCVGGRPSGCTSCVAGRVGVRAAVSRNAASCF